MAMPALGVAYYAFPVDPEPTAAPTAVALLLTLAAIGAIAWAITGQFRRYMRGDRPVQGRGPDSRHSMSPHVRPYLWAIGICWALPLVVVLGGYLVLPGDVPPGECEDIGFGCTLSAQDTWFLPVGLASPFLFCAGLVAMLLIGWAQHRRRRPAAGEAEVPRTAR